MPRAERRGSVGGGRGGQGAPPARGRKPGAQHAPLLGRQLRRPDISDQRFPRPRRFTPFLPNPSDASDPASCRPPAAIPTARPRRPPPPAPPPPPRPTPRSLQAPL